MAKTCAELGIPLVDLDDTPVIPGVPKIRPDNVALGHLAAEHFLERGHRHYAFAGFSSESYSCERRDGFVEALALAGHSCALLEMDYPGDDKPVWDSQQIELLAAWLKRLPSRWSARAHGFAGAASH